MLLKVRYISSSSPPSIPPPPPPHRHHQHHHHHHHHHIVIVVVTEPARYKFKSPNRSNPVVVLKLWEACDIFHRFCLVAEMWVLLIKRHDMLFHHPVLFHCCELIENANVFTFSERAFDKWFLHWLWGISNTFTFSGKQEDLFLVATGG